MKLIIEIGEEDRTRVGNLHFIPEELKVKIAFAISNGTPIPDNATNEEAIRALFPYTIFVEDRSTNRIVISKEWWNAKYKAEKEGAEE